MQCLSESSQNACDSASAMKPEFCQYEELVSKLPNLLENFMKLLS